MARRRRRLVWADRRSPTYDRSHCARKQSRGRKTESVDLDSFPMNTATPIPAHQKGKGAGLTVRPGWGTMVNDVIRTEGGVRRPPGPLWKTTRKSRSAKAFYPTADLRRAETMKAKFFYTGIRVKDLEASVKFYTTLLGMKVRGQNTVDAAKGTVVELICEGEGGNTLELNYRSEERRV